LFSAFSGFLQKNPQGAEVLLQALDFTLGDPLELVVVGDPYSQETQNLLLEINQKFLPSKILLFKNISAKDQELMELIPFLKNQKLVEGKPAVYACRNQTCDKPRTSPEELAAFLKMSFKN